MEAVVSGRRGLLLCALGVGLFPSCEPPCGLRLCDIRDPDCQRTTAQATACLNERPMVSVPMRVLPVEEFLNQSSGPVSDEQIQAERRWNKALSLVGLAPPDLDPAAAARASASRVAAYYADIEQGITIIDHGDPLDSLYAVTLLVHEYTHALQDKAVDLGAYFGRHAVTTDSALAASSLVEGDASHTEDLAAMNLFHTDSGGIPWAKMYQHWQTTARRARDLSPTPVLLAWAHFNYPFGTEMVSVYWRAGGWPAAHERYLRPPASTAQVLSELAGAPAAEGHWMKDLGDASIPVLPDRFRFLGADGLGAWTWLAFLAKRTLAQGVERELVAALRGDVFSWHLDAESGDVLVAWRLRLNPSLAARFAQEVSAANNRLWVTYVLGGDLVLIAAQADVLATVDAASFSWRGKPTQPPDTPVNPRSRPRVLCPSRAP